MLLPLAILLFTLSLLVLLVPTLFFLWVSLFRSQSTTNHASLKRSAAVVVLGDVGRSPRMCYHVESLANEGWKVGIVGYAGVALPPQLKRSTIRLHALSTPPPYISKLPRRGPFFLLVAPIKLLWQTCSLFWALTAKINPPPEVILVQTPPALPTLFVVQFVALLMRSTTRVIIDWHNLGYTILSMKLPASSPIVKLAEWLEKISGRSAFAHLFVTKAMMKNLSRKWGLQGHKRVLHDRPPAHFRKATVQETHELFSALVGRLNAPLVEHSATEGASVSASRPGASPRGSMEKSTAERSSSNGMTEFWPDFSMPDSTPFTRVVSPGELRDIADPRDGNDVGISSADAAAQMRRGLRRRGSGVSIEMEGAEDGASTTGSRPTSPADETGQQTARTTRSSLSPIRTEAATKVTGLARRESHEELRSSNSLAPERVARERYTLRRDRPALAVSSTSWTADEDFNMLLLAATLYEQRAREANQRAAGKVGEASASPDASSPLASPLLPTFFSEAIGAGKVGGPTKNRNEIGRSRRPPSGSLTGSGPNSVHGGRTSPTSPVLSTSSSNNHSPSSSLTINSPESTTGNFTLPKLLIIVTGKGELRAHYEKLIDKIEREMQWKWVRIRTAWLESEEYPVLLGSADIGISLHSSSSGLDLPMKVVDMLGCQLPVLALDFPCLDELVVNGRNGLTFSDGAGLERGLEAVLANFPNEDKWLARNIQEGTAFPSGMDDAFDEEEESYAVPADSLTNAQLDLNGHGPSTFTLLPSPTFPAADASTPTAPQARKWQFDTWRGNWRRVVRPLLFLEDQPEVDKKHSRKTAMSYPNISTSTTWGRRAWSASGRAAALSKKARTSEEAASTPLLSHDGSIRHISTTSEGDATGMQHPSSSHEADSSTDTDAYLRRRKRSDLQGLEGHFPPRQRASQDSTGFPIPHIKVSGASDAAS